MAKWWEDVGREGERERERRGGGPASGVDGPGGASGMNVGGESGTCVYEEVVADGRGRWWDAGEGEMASIAAMFSAVSGVLLRGVGDGEGEGG